MATVIMEKILCAPWQKGAGLSTVVVGQGGEAIASVFTGRDSYETRKRADLIIAAPELAQALQDLCRHAEKAGLCNDAHGIALLNASVDVLERAGWLS